MALVFDNSHPFSHGACSFVASAATEGEIISKVHIPIRIENAPPVTAVIDTGAAYLVCSPEIAELLDLDSAEKLDDIDTINIRGISIEGDLYSLLLTLMATEGGSLTQHVTGFMPRPKANQSREELLQIWRRFPEVFIGWTGCLEWFRFAIDPVEDMFYFGSIYVHLNKH